MEHDRIRESLEAFFDGELDSSARADVSSHLKYCAECQESRRRWEKIAAHFFRAPPRPSRAETEAFVHRILTRIETQAPDTPSSWASLWQWLEERMLVPALGMGLAALLISFVVSGPESFAPADALLLVHSSGHSASSWALPPGPSNQEGWPPISLEGE